jgi:hypothetical protein
LFKLGCVKRCRRRYRQGKGPQRAEYEAEMAALRLSHVAVRTAWWVCAIRESS